MTEFERAELTEFLRSRGWTFNKTYIGDRRHLIIQVKADATRSESAQWKPPSCPLVPEVEYW